MALQVTETFRENCYDLSKEQRMLLMSDGVVISNEDIDVNDSVKFNIASITSQQVQFGETPTNTISVSILNQDGRFSAEDIAGKEFSCNIGVEVDRGQQNFPPMSIAVIDANGYSISVHSDEPYIRGNCTFASVLPQLENGDPCKIVFVYGTVFFVVNDGTTTYYAKHEETASHVYGAYTTPSDLECAMLDRIMAAPYNGISYYEGGMSEFRYVGEYTDEGEWASARGSVVHVFDALAHSIRNWVVGLGMDAPDPGTIPSTDYKTWDQMKEDTWGGRKSHLWGDYSGYSIFDIVRYDSKDYGIWHFDRPRRINTAVITLSGKDRMTAFDEDSINFASNAPSALLTARGMIFAIANYKGVPTGDMSGMNELSGEITIDPTEYYNYKSLKDLLSYAAEVCGVNLFFDRWGQLACTNSDNTPVPIPYCYTFDVADYTAHTIGKMLVYHQGDYFAYQEDLTVEDGVTYEWGDNPFFNKSSLTGSWFSQNMHKKYGGFRNAITVTEADYSLWCDDVYSWTDENNVTYREPIFTMTVEWNGSGRVTYANYGEETRPLAQYDKRIESVSSINDNNLHGFNKAQNADKLYFDSNGLTVESGGLRVKNADGLVVLDADSEGNLTLTGKINADSGFVGNWIITNEGLEWSEGEEFIQLEPAKYNSAVRVGNAVYVTEIKSDGMWFRDDLNGTQGISGSLQFWSDATTGERFIELTCPPNVPGVQSAIYLDADTIGLDASNSLYFFNIQPLAASSNLIISNNKIYRSSSIRAIKKDIKTIENASEKVDNLRGVSFKSKCEGDDPNRRFYGLIAEEVEEVAPELCTYEDDKLVGVQYDRICALLLEDNKACHKRIEDLEKRLNELERRMK